ncbi:MAG: hypothetical protein LBB05_00425 [Puniceicoccales bacterium]|nr:hypothetical protein [Puniceicoccales bacterium]
MMQSLLGEKLLSFSERVQFFIHHGADVGRVAALLCESGFSREAVEKEMQCARTFLLEGKFHERLVECAMQCDSADPQLGENERRAQVEKKVRIIVEEVEDMYADDEEIDTISEILTDKFPGYERVIELAIEDIRRKFVEPDPLPEKESPETQILKILLNTIAERDPGAMQAIIESLREAFRNRFTCEEIIDFAIKYVEYKFVTPYTPPKQELATFLKGQAAKVLLHTIAERDPGAIQVIVDQIKAVFMGKFSHYEEVIDFSTKYVGYKIAMLNMPPNQEEQELPLTVQTLKALLHIACTMNPMTLQTMIDPVKAVFRSRFPHCEAIIDLLVKSTLNTPPGREIFPEMQESKVLWNAFLGIIRQDPAIMQATITPIMAILAGIFSRCQEVIAPEMSSYGEEIIDLAINYILDMLSEQDVTRWSPSTIQPIAESIRTFLTERFPFCKKIINNAIIHMLNMPSEQGLSLGM